MLDWQQCCQPCPFPANLGLFFLELRVFLKTCGLLAFGLVLIEIFLFFADFCFADCFFQILWHFCCLNLLLKADWACFCEDLLIFGLFFRICHPDPDSLFDFLANFCVLLNFPAKAFWACFSVKLPIFGLFFKFIACSWKIIWHHCLAVQQ